MPKDFAQDIFSIESNKQFEELCLRVFKYQLENCELYARFCTHLGIVREKVKTSADIPFLPIEFFKSHKIISGIRTPQIVFNSSGTTGTNQSKHVVSDLSYYVQSYRKAFQLFYGDPADYAILGLLPSYLEREGSSLTFMVDDLIKQSGHPSSGYYLNNHSELFETLRTLQKSGQKTLLIGVTYALLDFVETFHLDFPELVVMETGGMKGKRKELVRAELHALLKKGFGVDHIHSEYGMTELLSQAYSKGNGLFNCPPWMNIMCRDTNDPLSLLPPGRTGGLNIIDLANLHSCAFIATQDLGLVHPDGSFEVSGRFDNSDIRGCNLLVQ